VNENTLFKHFRYMRAAALTYLFAFSWVQ